MATDFNEQFKKYYEANKGEYDTEADIKAKEINYKDYFNQKLQNANLRALSQKYFRANMENNGLLGTGEMVSANLRNDQYYNSLDNANFENMQAKNNAITQQGITNYENGLNADIEKYIGYMQQFQGNKSDLDKVLREEYHLLNDNGTWNDAELSKYGADRIQDLKTQYNIAVGNLKDDTLKVGNDPRTGNPITIPLTGGVNFTTEDGGTTTLQTLNSQTLGNDWSDFLWSEDNFWKQKADTVLSSGQGVRDEQKAMVNLINDGGNHEGQIFLLSNTKSHNATVAYVYKNGTFYRVKPQDIIGKNITYIKGGKVKSNDTVFGDEEALRKAITGHKNKDF